ncbi:MAG TPA: alpha/beta hydrolase [Nitrospirota bacterium]|nr:alpha/beta hydrolase [Nitrospirota bacterium]
MKIIIPILFLLIIAALILWRSNIQNKLIYYPDSSLPSEEWLKADNLNYWPSSLKDYRGFVSINQTEPLNGTIIVFHGNAGTAADRLFYVKCLAPLGYRVVLAEYPAYGRRKGGVGETVFVKDAAETVRLAFQQYGAPLYLLGESLGCGVAAAVVKDAKVEIGGIILITPWDTLASVAQSMFPYFPVRLFLKDRYDNIGNLEFFKKGIAVVGAERDEIVPVEHANRLYLALPGKAKKKWILNGVGHNDWAIFADRPFFKEIMDFVRYHDRG